MTQCGFHFNGPRCTGCHTCVMACKDNKDLSTEYAFRQVYEYGDGTWKKGADGLWSSDAFMYFVSTACNHCTDPACVRECPQGAVHKDEETGLVLPDDTKCIGCGTCVKACPYGVPKVNTETSKMVKCDGCHDRVVAGEKPVCVEACPLRALDFDDIEKLRADYGDTAAIAPLPDPSQTGPNVVITPPKNAMPFDTKTGSIQNSNELV